MKGFRELEKEVIACDLCVKCGTCIGVCPTETLEFEKETVIDKKGKCIACGMCSKVCPGRNFSWQEWSQKVYGKEYDSNDVFGMYQDVFNVHAQDSSIRHEAASGGAVTQLLIDMLERHQIGGAVVTRSKDNIPYEFETHIATTREEILEAAQSKYMIIPVNRIVKEIKQQEERIAFVGLPCQVQGMRKAIEADAELKKKVEVLISVFCGFNMEPAATDYLISKGRIRKEAVTKLQYRKKLGKGTGFYIEDSSGKSFFVNKHGYTFLNLIFSPKRCWKCYDYSGEFADIAVGDAWNKGQGWSRVIVRTNQGRELLEQSVHEGTLFCEKADIDEILRTQNQVISYKKKQIGIRKKFMRSFPEYGIAFPKQNVKIRIKGLMMYVILTFFKTPPGKIAVRILPFRLMTKLSSRLKGNELVK